MTAKRIKIVCAVIAAALVLVVVTLPVICRAYRDRSIERSYFAMSGLVQVVDKAESSEGWEIVIKQSGGDIVGWFVLSCTEDQFNMVDIGEYVYCDRSQSALTHDGTVHNIAPRS